MEIGHERPKQNIVSASSKSTIIFKPLNNPSPFRGSDYLFFILFLSSVIGEQLRRYGVGLNACRLTLGVKFVNVIKGQLAHLDAL